jgi:ubiquinone/menaquinone biosynthesis C-methylase UbiE
MDADKYEKRWRRYLEKTHQNVIQTLEEELDDKNDLELLDVSTGTGKIHEKLAESSLTFQKLVFNDPDKEMLSEDKKQEIRETFDSEIRFSHYQAERLQYLNKSFDVVLSLNAYHRYWNKYRFFEEANRCVKDHGHVLIQDWNNDRWFRPLYWAIQHYTEEHIRAENSDQVLMRAAERRFEPKKRKTWSWRWWPFYTILLEKYDIINDMPDEELKKLKLTPPKDPEEDDEADKNDEDKDK